MVLSPRYSVGLAYSGVSSRLGDLILVVFWTGVVLLEEVDICEIRANKPRDHFVCVSIQSKVSCDALMSVRTIFVWIRLAACPSLAWTPAH